MPGSRCIELRTEPFGQTGCSSAGQAQKQLPARRWTRPAGIFGTWARRCGRAKSPGTSRSCTRPVAGLPRPRAVSQCPRGHEAGRIERSASAMFREGEHRQTHVGTIFQKDRREIAHRNWRLQIISEAAGQASTPRIPESPVATGGALQEPDTGLQSPHFKLKSLVRGIVSFLSGITWAYRPGVSWGAGASWRRPRGTQPFGGRRTRGAYRAGDSVVRRSFSTPDYAGRPVIVSVGIQSMDRDYRGGGTDIGLAGHLPSTPKT